MSALASALNLHAEKSEFLIGIVERLTFHSEDSGYTVARLKVTSFKDLVTIVGNFASIQPGQTLKLKGQWRDHPEYGSQFHVGSYQETKPATLTGMEKYLGSGLIKGVGPVTASRIVAHFGLDTLSIIENQISRLQEVPGIGKKRITQIQKAWCEQKIIKEVMVFLQGHGVSTVYAVKIFKKYGEKAISIVTENPYQLAEDIYGIGFKSADKIATNIGISPWSKFRYRAGILHVLAEAAEEGHCFLPQPELANLTVEKLTTPSHETDKNAVANVLQEMSQKHDLVIETAAEGMELFYKPTFYHTERNLASLIQNRSSSPVSVDLPRVQKWIERFTKYKGIQLSEKQQLAVEMAASSRIMILTGGPGCGKTFTTHTIVSLWKAMGKKIAASSPTGRAAQRLSEMTGMEASTLHRLLEFDPSNMGFKRDVDNPLPIDALVVDEASMLDLFLAYSLLKAIPREAQLLLVGDIDQLPSVGPGQVLKDLICAASIPVVRLTQVFRQAASSAIVEVAHQINQGQFPTIEPISDNPRSNCLWHNGGQQPEHGVQVISELITNFLPKRGFNVSTDVMVLSPMIRGAVGTRHLNFVLQQLINPPSPDKAEISRNGMVFRVGDKVIQLKNDYKREVFNGDIGTIEAIDTTEQEVVIRFDQRLVAYDFADLNEVSLAFSISIHKSQGSEYPVVILPLYMTHYVMLSRNLLYTGLTRAKKLTILVGSKKAIGIAVKQIKEQSRYTRLSERLKVVSD